MKIGKIIIALLALSLLAAGEAWAATSTANLTINYTIASRADLTLGATSITFPDSDPNSNPTVTAGPVTVTASVRTGATSSPGLTVVTGGDLVAGTNTIPIGNITWTATGTGFVAGTMNKTTAQSAGQWTGSGSYSGSFTYALVNSWNYDTGSYSATATYTLTAP